MCQRVKMRVNVDVRAREGHVSKNLLASCDQMFLVPNYSLVSLEKSDAAVCVFVLMCFLRSLFHTLIV